MSRPPLTAPLRKQRPATSQKAHNQVATTKQRYMGNLTLQHSDSGAPLCGTVSRRETKAIIQIISARNKGTSQHSLKHTKAGKIMQNQSTLQLCNRTRSLRTCESTSTIAAMRQISLPME
eukprot:5625071-Heterocapsa_arctica.AAC.1